ncbi:SLBB domain-containing protein [candidate division KSB1 bacterium]|nr:SLBB domain-containing protein [candidate division KSB1 bacterium]
MRNLTLAFAVVVSCLLAAGSESVICQIATSQLSSSTTEEKKEKLPLLEEPQKVIPLNQAIETAIDPDEYIVDAGDVFSINVWGRDGMEFPSQVTPEGNLIIGTVGSIRVSGKTLTEVKQAVREAGEKKYKLEKITANLIQLRVFRIHITGEVRKPGAYVAQAVDRVYTLIEDAEGITAWGNEREVQIRHKENSVDTLDLFNYKKLGSLEQNIFVQNGDVIYVPPLQLTEKTVTLAGRATQRGIHQILPNETLKNFLLRVNAFYNQDLDVENIYVVRADEQRKEHYIFIDLMGSARKSEHPELVDDLLLKDGDKIFLPSLKSDVYVHGAVQTPGAYIFNAGYTARDYVGIAGGTIEMGKMENIKVIHIRTKKIEKGPDIQIERGDTIIVPISFRRQFTDYLQILSSFATLTFAFMAAQR